MPLDPRAAVSAALAEHYAIEVATLEPGPRQFVAETFVAIDLAGEAHFCKATFKQGFVPDIVAGLGGHIPRVDLPSTTEADSVLERLERAIRYDGHDAVLVELASVARRRLDRFRRLGDVHRAAAERCRARDIPLVMTHGDAPGNVIVRSAHDFTIIDWDEAMLAPAERDLWILEHEPAVIVGYRTVRPDFEVDPHARTHAVLRYCFSAARAYLDEIESVAAPATRTNYLGGLDGLLDGWMSRALRGIEECAALVASR